MTQQASDSSGASAVLAATLARLEPVARAIGVTRLANMTGLDAIGLPIWTAIRPTSRVLATSQGKGLCHAQAQVSALMESIEIWHAESHCQNLVFESPARVSAATGLPFVAPQSLAVLKNVRIANTEPILWTHGRHLATDAPVLVPWEAVTLNTLTTVARRTLVMSSSGLSGGVGQWEAILHGLCELVERYDMAGWFGWTTQQRNARRVDLAGAGGALRDVIGQVEQHCMLALWDMTGALGIPSYVCMLVDHAGADTGLEVGRCSGYATHAQAATAALRAILEAVQARATIIAGSRDDLGEEEFEGSRDLDQSAAMRREIGAAVRGCALRADAPLAGLAPREAVRQLLSIFADNGIADAYVVDLTQERFGIPVFKCVVPGLTTPSLSTIMRELNMNRNTGNWDALFAAKANTIAQASAT